MPVIAGAPVLSLFQWVVLGSVFLVTPLVLVLFAKWISRLRQRRSLKQAPASSTVQRGSGQQLSWSGNEPFFSSGDPNASLFSWGQSPHGQLGQSKKSSATPTTSKPPKNNQLDREGTGMTLLACPELSLNQSQVGQAGASLVSFVEKLANHGYDAKDDDIGSEDATTWFQDLKKIAENMSTETTKDEEVKQLEAVNEALALPQEDKQAQVLPFPVTFPSQATSIKKVSCGWGHCAAVDYGGSVLTWGLNDDGQLGLGDKRNRETPTLLEDKLLSKYQLSSVTCGSHHTLALASGVHYSLRHRHLRGLFSWGCGANGQLGLGSTISHSNPQRIDFFFGDQDEQGLDIAMIASGGCHNLALTKDHRVFSWGSNGYGELGIDEEAEVFSKPSPVLTLAEQQVVFIDCGEVTSAAVTNDTRVFMWGGNFHGRLGLGVPGDQRIPKRLTRLDEKRIKKVSCGCYHTLALTESGNVYGWGYAQNMRLGKFVEGDQKIPVLTHQRVSEANETVICDIDCGYGHSLFVSKSGLVSAWNCPEQDGSSSSFSQYKIHPENTQDFTYKVSCGQVHSVVLVEGSSDISNISFLQLEHHPSSVLSMLQNFQDQQHVSNKHVEEQKIDLEIILKTMEMAFADDEHENLTIDLTQETIEAEMFEMKESTDYDIIVRFEVLSDSVLINLKMDITFTRLGFAIANEAFNLGSWGPGSHTVMEYGCVPNGVFARGEYVAKATFLQNDRVFRTLEYKIKIVS